MDCVRTQPDFHAGPFAVYCRPFVGDFLRTVRDWYDLAIWSSASRLYVEEVVENLIPDRTSLQFLWSGDRCTRRLHPETMESYWVKDLKKVKRLGFSLERVLMIDDSPEKLERHYGNLMRVRSFEGDMTDTELRNILPFLDHLRSSTNLRIIEKRLWRSFIRPAPTSRNPLPRHAECVIPANHQGGRHDQDHARPVLGDASREGPAGP